jgi:broad specificity phosphatase PhoE
LLFGNADNRLHRTINPALARPPEVSLYKRRVQASPCRLLLPAQLSKDGQFHEALDGNDLLMAARALWLVRHGESFANVAASEAQAAGADSIVVQNRDADVPLSPVGESQAAALGVWLREQGAETAVGAVWASSYLRAQQTISLAMGAADMTHPIRIDDRLRDRELGILDLLTSFGVENRFPAEAERRRWLGKFYYRPPGGESWADVALRLRTFLSDLSDTDDERPVVIATHDAVIMLFIYVCCGLTEEKLLAFARDNTVLNASVTQLVRAPGAERWTLQGFAVHDHLQRAGVPTTEHPGDHHDVHD